MPTGFNLGPITIHYYGIIIILGILVALVMISREATRRGKPLDFLIDAIPWIFLGGVIGARLWHILTPPQSMVNRGITTQYYLTHLNAAIAIWKGGAGIFGAVIGGTIALSIFARRSVLNMAFLLWVGRKYQDQIKSGSLFLIYLIFYGFGRAGLEFLRLDISSFQGININQAFMTAVVLVAGVLFIIRQKRIPSEPSIQ